jgi:hypothetical protein
MLFELFWAGYPVIHNAMSWKPFGYCYPGADLDCIGNLYDAIRTTHHEKLESYKAHTKALTWKHSPYNPEVQKAWAELLA